MIDQYTIRKLDPSDAQNFQHLHLKARRTDADVFVSTLEEEQNCTLEQIKQRLQTNYILGAFNNDKLLGTLVFMEQEKQKFKHIGILGGMYVDPDYRGRGVNRKIIGRLKQWSISQDITEMRLDVYDNNLTAIKAYEGAGFTKHMVEMRMGLHED